MDSEPELDRRKAEARRLARAARRGMRNGEAAAHALILNFPEKLQSLNPIAFYWRLGSEIDPQPLMETLARSGRDIALPCMVGRAAPPLFLRYRHGDRLTPDAFGILAPEPSAEPLAPRLILTPLLAFDRRGGRLGQGGGHYDRILAALKPKGVIACGLAYAAQELPEIPCGPHDQTLDWIVTETEAIRAAPLAGGGSAG